MTQVQTESQQDIGLLDCFKLFSKGDELEAKCDKCKTSEKHHKKMVVQNMPPVLILHLKRFKVTS